MFKVTYEVTAYDFNACFGVYPSTETFTDTLTQEQLDRLLESPRIRIISKEDA